MIVWANLDAEARWAGITLPKAVLQRLAALAPLLAVLDELGELADGPVEVFAPAAVDSARIKLAAHATVTMRIGVPARYDLAWAQPSAKAANDRRLNLRLHERLGTRLPGQRVITSVDELEGARGKWVCKAPWTAAGRDRAYGDGAPVGDNRIYVTRLLERFGALLYEPWCERLFDVGVCAHTNGSKHAPHTLLSDARGGFVGISLAPPPLSPDESAQLDRVVDEARAELLREGYAGPFSVDAFVYRATDETRLLHAPCEINARYTFGHVAHALAKRYGATRLGFGEAPPGATVLIDGAAWIAT
jgi:hypothetical protein